MDNIHICPNCNETVKYSNRCNYLRAERTNAWCKKCSANKPDRINKIGKSHLGKKRPDWWCDNIRKSKLGHEVSDEARKKLSVACAGRILTEEHKNKIRNGVLKSWTSERKKEYRLNSIKKIEKERLNGNQLYPAFNRFACEKIDEYGKKNEYNFKHAMNGGEFYIKELGYWVDGYDKEKNVVIEIDELHHFNLNGTLKSKDVQRQKEIVDNLGCKFIRIKLEN